MGPNLLLVWVQIVMRVGNVVGLIGWCVLWQWSSLAVFVDQVGLSVNFLKFPILFVK